jgi:hypothetical protein
MQCVRVVSRRRWLRTCWPTNQTQARRVHHALLEDAAEDCSLIVPAHFRGTRRMHIHRRLPASGRASLTTAAELNRDETALGLAHGQRFRIHESTSLCIRRAQPSQQKVQELPARTGSATERRQPSGRLD